MESEYKIVRPQFFEIVGANKQDNAPAVFNVGGGKNIYYRILIKPIIKDEERDCEVVDEDEKIIYQVPQYMVQSIIDRIEYERMTRDWVKTIKFNDDEQENLRYLALMLYKCGHNDIAEKIEGQRLENKQPEAFTYEQLKNEAVQLITFNVYQSELKRLSPIWKMRNEKVPTIFSELSEFFKSI